MVLHLNSCRSNRPIANFMKLMKSEDREAQEIRISLLLLVIILFTGELYISVGLEEAGQ